VSFKSGGMLAGSVLVRSEPRALQNCWVGMTTATLLYRSANGDTWSLEENAAGKLLVVHIGNPSSGGHRTATPASEFMEHGGSGPEYQALRRELDKRSTLDEKIMDKVSKDCPL